MNKPMVLQMGDRARLSTSQIDALAYLVNKHGPIDTKGAIEMYEKEFPGVKVPAFFATLFAQATNEGKIAKVARGIYGPI